MRLHTHQCMRTGRRICAVDTLTTITEKALDDMEELYNKKRRSHPDHQKVLSEFWVFQEKVDMKVSAFSFTTSLLVFGYL